MKIDKKYVLIYFKDRKPVRKHYDTSSKAYYDYQERGCIFVELFNESGVKLSSYPKNPYDNTTI